MGHANARPATATPPAFTASPRHKALAAQQGQRVVHLVVHVAAQCFGRVLQKTVPHIDVVCLIRAWRMAANKVYRQFGLQSAFTDLAHKAGGGFFGQQRLFGCPCGKAKEQREQRVLVFVALGGFCPRLAGGLGGLTAFL